MNYTEKKSMYVVDYERGSSSVHEFMNGRDLQILRNKEKKGSVKITNMICLGTTLRK